MSKDMIASILVLLLFIILDGTLFGFATATANVNEGDIMKRADEGHKKSSKILKLMENSLRLNCTIQIMAMVMNVIVGAFILGRVANLFGDMLHIKILTAVVIMIIVALFGILIPVKISVLHADRVVYDLFGVVNAVMLVLSPIIYVVTLVGNVILRIFGINPNADMDNVTEEEILTMVNEGHEKGVIEAEEAEMISNIFEFGEKDASDIMTHRSNINAIDGNLTLEDAVSYMLLENNSRYPVYDGDINTIVGIVHVKDALKEYGNRAQAETPIKDVKEVLYEVELVPETRNIDDLFRLMQRKKMHMAIVVDEYGQTAGLVTMEDILEEIVGNILDEHDEDEEQIKLSEDNTYIVDGMTLLEDLEEELGIEFEVEDINTINGFMILNTGKIPRPEHVGMEVVHAGYVFRIEEVEGKTIKLVYISKK